MLVSDFHPVDDYGNAIVWQSFDQFQRAMHYFFED